MDGHPTLVELQGFVSGELSRERARFVVLHFLKGCEQCRMVLAPHLLSQLGWKLNLNPLTPEPGQVVAVDQALKVADLQGPPPSSGPTPREEALAWLTAGGVAALADAPPHLDGVTLVEALLERSWELRYEDPRHMVEFAEAAQCHASKLCPELCGEDRVRDLRLRSWIELGNAYRVADDLDRSDEALSYAASLLTEDNKNGLLAARFFTVLASFYGSRRLFEAADMALDAAHNLYVRHGEGHLAGRTLIIRGINTGYRGEPEEAIRLIQRGLAAVDEEREPDIVFLAIHNQAYLLVDQGHFRQAKRALWELKRRGLPLGGPLNEIKVRWLDGRIYAGLGELVWAEQALSQVKQGFAEANLRYKAALAGTELGAVLLRQGRWKCAEKEALEAVEIFRALSVSAEAAKAIALLKNAFETKAATVALVEYVADFLRRAEHDPKARFLPQP